MSTTTIKLSNGGQTVMDTADYKRFLTLPHRDFGALVIRPADHAWRKNGKDKWFYAHRTASRNGRKVNVLLHRLITGAKPGQYVDHINGDTFDNRRVNLRICTNADNIRNSHSVRGWSRFHGVSPSGNRWVAQIQANYKKQKIGKYRTEIEAARAYDAKAVELFGEFARLNFPESLFKEP